MAVEAASDIEVPTAILLDGAVPGPSGYAALNMVPAQGCWNRGYRGAFRNLGLFASGLLLLAFAAFARNSSGSHSMAQSPGEAVVLLEGISAESCVAGCTEDYRPSRPCQCNEQCGKYGDCCSDYKEQCAPQDSHQGGDVDKDSYCDAEGADCWTSRCCRDSKLSCFEKYKGVGICKATCVPGIDHMSCAALTTQSCRAYGCIPYKAMNGCQCDSLCHKYGNCCTDFELHCAAKLTTSSTTATSSTSTDATTARSSKPSTSADTTTANITTAITTTLAASKAKAAAHAPTGGLVANMSVLRKLAKDYKLDEDSVALSHIPPMAGQAPAVSTKIASAGL